MKRGSGRVGFAFSPVYSVKTLQLSVIFDNMDMQRQQHVITEKNLSSTNKAQIRLNSREQYKKVHIIPWDNIARIYFCLTPGHVR